MANFCLPSSLTIKFRSALKSGELDPAKLSEMDSAERREAFENVVGSDSAKDLNAAFESKLLLKNQQIGILNWAKSAAGLKLPDIQDLVTKISKMDKILSPDDLQHFLSDLAAKKLGTEVTREEAQHIADKSRTLQQAKALVKPEDPIASDSRLTYGAAKVALEKYVNELKRSNDSDFDKFKTNPVKTAGAVASRIGGFAKSFKAIGDISSLFRQGLKTLFTNPSIWADNAMKTFGDVTRQLGKAGTNDDISDAIQADVQSRPNAMNGMYKKMGLEIGNTEEALPSSAPEKVPLFGRLFKATEVGFNGFLYRTRADVADKLLEVAQKSGVDISDKEQLQSMGKLVNALTGRGYLGALEAGSKALNNVFFSPKFIKSNIDFLTAHQFQKDVTPFVRKQAAINLVKVASGIGAILTIANYVAPKSVDWDPRSSNFGHIKVGKLSFDVSGGMATLVNLAARLAENSTKSSTTGKITPLNTGKFGAETSTDMVVNFITNKESPVASVISDIFNRSTFGGGKPTVLGEATNAFAPFPVQNMLEAIPQVGATNALLGEIADALGLYETIPTPKK